MDLSFDIAEKYFWTWLDFWRFGPKRFSEELQIRPIFYLSGFQFFLGSLIILALIWALAFGVLQEIPKNSYPYLHLGDEKVFVALRVLWLFSIVVFGSLVQSAVLRWPLKSPADIKDLFIAKFYCSAVIVVLAGIDVLAAMLIFWIATRLSAHDGAFLILAWAFAEFLIFFIIISYYEMVTICVFTRLRKRRFVEAAFAFGLIISTVTTPTGGLIGTYFDHSTGLPYDLFDAIFIPCLFLPAVIAVWYVRRRLPRLQTLVQNEYAALSASANPRPEAAISS